MTNILLLPQINARFSIINNAGWYDAIAFRTIGTSGPLDISGIRFRGAVRPSSDSSYEILGIDTAVGTLINNGVTGVLRWNVSPDTLKSVKSGFYEFDLLAVADDKTINLFQKSGPAKVVVNRGITR